MTVEPFQQAKTIAFALLGSSVVSDDDLQTAVSRACEVVEASNAAANLDRQHLVRVLQESLNIFQADSSSLDNDEGHVEWLPEVEGSLEWAFWNRYGRYLREREGLPPIVVERLDSTTRRILGKLENPSRTGPWDRRGMVVGQVQSGKTGNYTGLICRAADAGYKVIVVLAGTHNSLRSQTQLRLDSGFLGYDTQIRQQVFEDDDGFAKVALGVGRLIGEKRPLAASLTTSLDRGDFGKKNAASFGGLLGQYPVLVVVKKHTGILGNLHDWLRDVHGTGEPRRIRDLALLVIDDEADNASVNTNKIYTPAGELDPNLDPTMVNQAIRRLLMLFDRRAYVGYTATPFANIYIEPDLEHPEFGKDLFPSSFIEYLRPPSNYFGPVRLFGLDEEDPLPLFRQVKDHATWVPDRHKPDWSPGSLPDSLKLALRSFVLARAVRLARGQTKMHNSMLVHVTRFQKIQTEVRRQVEAELDLLRAGLRHGAGEKGKFSEYERLRQLWDCDFVPTTEAFDPDAFPRLTWREVEAELVNAVTPIQVMTINGDARDALTYFENREHGLNVIAIGGDKLSRGLTLEGLTVSYYLRASRTFDTLLQMGRWFGYRDHYEDVCRLYTTEDLWNAYAQVSEANEQLIEEFEEMAARGKAPDDYGLKVQNSVQGMLVTAANKMRAGQLLKIGFAGTLSESVLIPCDKERASRNFEYLVSFVEGLQSRTRLTAPEPSANWIWRDVPGQLVADGFFAGLTTPEAAWKVNSQVIASYIHNRIADAELTDWTVVLVSNSGAKPLYDLAGLRVGLTTRNPVKDRENKVWQEGSYSIRRMLNPPDEWIDFSDEEVKELTRRTQEAWDRDRGRRKKRPDQPSGNIVRHERSAERGLLLIYPLQPVAEDLRNLAREGLEIFDGPLVGFCASFPASDRAPAMDYVVNVRFLNELFGVEDDDSGA